MIADRNVSSTFSKIAVVIPVYNAGSFVRQACGAALQQPEVGEVILVEDGSLDSSLNVCESLARENERVHVLRHEDGVNRGAGASRNLGIRSADYEWIALLDADDLYLDGRFDFFNKIVNTHPDAEGVCEAVGAIFETREAEGNWNRSLLDTLKQRYRPDELFVNQAPVGNGGYCCTPGWTVKRSALERCGMFPEHLRMHQDTALYVKLAGGAVIYPGELSKPVAVRRVHDRNRISALEKASWRKRAWARSLFWHDVCKWTKNNMERESVDLVYRRYFEDIECLSNTDKKQMHWIRRYFMGLLNLGLLPFVYPKVLFISHYYMHIVEKIRVGAWLVCKRCQRDNSMA